MDYYQEPISNAELRMLDDGPQPDKYGNRGQLIKTWKFRGYEFKMEVAYIPEDDKEEERMQFFVTMPDKMYFSIGFGGSMTNTDMIAWHADATRSKVVDYWSYFRDTPKMDDNQDLTQ